MIGNFIKIDSKYININDVIEIKESHDNTKLFIIYKNWQIMSEYKENFSSTYYNYFDKVHTTFNGTIRDLFKEVHNFQFQEKVDKLLK